MNWLQATEIKVGIMVLVVGSLIAFMSMQVSDDPSYLGRSKKAWFLLPNADGLIKNSSVRTAGIPIGVIRDIKLQDGQARIEITYKSEIQLTTSAAAQIKSIGILGDKHVELYPGSPTDPPLPDDAQILIVKDKGSMDNLMNSVAEVTDSLKSVAESLKEATSEDGTRKHILGRIISNIERITQDVSQMTGENKDKIGEIVDQVHDVTSTLSDLVNDESEDGFKKSWKKAVASLSRIDSILKNTDDITGKINRGEGTIGKLINDDSTVEELNTALSGVSSMMDTAGKVQTGFDFHGEYLNNVKATKSYIGITIEPGLDRYYYLALVDDPAGVVEKTDTKTTSGGSTTADYSEQKTYYSKTKLTALYAKNFWDFSIKAGLIENTGGFGLDYNFYKKKMRVSLEAFDLGKAQLRAMAQYKLGHGFYVLGGVTDILDKNDSRSGYLGAGLFLTNDDLKLLLSRSPF